MRHVILLQVKFTDEPARLSLDPIYYRCICVNVLTNSTVSYTCLLFLETLDCPTDFETIFIKRENATKILATTHKLLKKYQYTPNK